MKKANEILDIKFSKPQNVNCAFFISIKQLACSNFSYIKSINISNQNRHNSQIAGKSIDFSVSI